VGRDADLLQQIAEKGGLHAHICQSVEELCNEFNRGGGLVFLTEEGLYMEHSDRLSECVKAQEPWSDMPFVVLTSRGDVNERVAKTAALLEPLGNVTIIERPVRPATILTAFRAALRNRQKQYEVRKRLNQLKSSYDRLSLTLRAASAGSWEWEADGGRLFWSKEFYDIFGLDSSRAPINDDMLERVHPEDRDKMRNEVANAVLHKHDFRVEFRIFHPTRGLRWIGSFGKAQVGDDGEIEGMSGIAIDITDRKLVQEELEQRVNQRTRELTAANEEMQGFTYSVSHDLRAPLRAIVSTSSILLEELGPTLKEEYRELLERQVHNANKLGDLIDELLKMSRLSRQEMVVAHLDMSRLASEVASEVLNNNGYDCIEVRIQPNMEARGDERLIRLLLQNLIENACKFSPQGGQVSIGSMLIEGRTAFFVSDHGIGFQMRYAPKLFMPFERLVNEADYPGTGIGLANVQRIAARHGGRVWASSEGEGKGSTFFFTLGPHFA